MKLIQVQAAADTGDIRTLYEAAFPPSEKKPFSLILKKCDEGQMEILRLTDDTGAFIGLAISIFYKNLVLLDYLAIAPHKRGGGYGSQALSLLRERYAGKRFLLEIEDTEEQEADNIADRIRRKQFYLRNGLKEMPFRVWLFGVRMQILTDGSTVSFPEYHAIFPAVFSPRAGENVRLYE